MVSNVQRAREALGARLRELRIGATPALNGKEFAARLGWQASKVSKIEIGRQTPSTSDIDAWTALVGRPEEANHLQEELAALQRFYSEWRHQLRGGLRFRQQQAATFEAAARVIRAFEPAYVPGLLQTADYARGRLVDAAHMHQTPDDVDDAVTTRMHRQEVLYRNEKRFHFVIGEAALRSGAASPPETMLVQLDRLVATTTLRHVRLGIVPFGTLWRTHVDHGFWIFDEDFVLVETIGAELRLTQPDELALYRRVFDRLASIAHYGQGARVIIMAALAEIAAQCSASSPSPEAT